MHHLTHSLRQEKTKINMTSVGTPVKLGPCCANALSAADEEEAVTALIFHAAQDCHIKIQQPVSAINDSEQSKLVHVCGEVIASSKGHCLTNIPPRCSLHELSFSDLMRVLHGELGSTLKALEFEAHRCFIFTLATKWCWTKSLVMTPSSSALIWWMMPELGFVSHIRPEES